MGAHDGAVNHVDIPVDVPGMIGLFLHSGKQLCPQALMLPAVEPGSHGFPVAIAIGQVTPGASRSLEPEDAIEHGAVIQGGASCSRALWGKQWSQLAPLLVRQFVASYHMSFSPMDGSLQTHPKGEAA